MTRPIRFGILTSHDVPWPALAESWSVLQAMGFDSLWLYDHHASPGQPTIPLLDSWTLLGALATRTTRVRLGTLVTNVARRPPALLAKQVVTVDHLSGGRLDVGLGPGYYEQEHRWLGIDFPALERRVARFGEAVAAVDALLRQERTTLAGDFYRLDDAPMYPPPVQRPRPPLVLGAMHPAALPVVAAFADVWNPLAGAGMSPDGVAALIRERADLLAEHCAAIGRDPGAITRSYLVGWADETPFASIQAFRDLVGRYAALGIGEFVFYHRPGDARQDGMSPRLRGRWGDLETLERVATEAIPAIRASR